MTVPFRHLEVTPILLEVGVYADANGTRVKWEPAWVVYDAQPDTDGEGAGFRLVQHALGYKDRTMTCWCPEGRHETEEACQHERAVAEHLNPKPEAVGLVTERRFSAGVFCD